MPRGRKAPQRTHPSGLPVATILTEFGAKLHAMDRLLTQCEAKYGRRVKILDHPVLGPLTAAQWRKFHRIHGLHHAGQIRRLRAMRGLTAGAVSD